MIHIEADVMAGARTAAGVCMGVKPGDRVAVISDQATAMVGEALVRASLDLDGEARLFLLEDYATRPIRELPEALVEALVDWRPTVTFYAAASQPGEIAFRIALRRMLLDELKVRHGHMPGITPLLMREGMAVDYRLVERVTRRVWERVRQARTIHVTNASGTDLTVRFDPERRWVPCTGIYHDPGSWGNLPEGEVFTAPVSADGVLVVALLGDHFSEKYGVLDRPVTIRVRDGWVTEVSCADPDLAAELFEYLRSAENGARMGEFAIGTNVALRELTGNLLQDEKIPGVHVAFGNPYPEETGADWSSTVHVDVIPVRTTIVVDGEEIMRDGRFSPTLVGE